MAGILPDDDGFSRRHKDIEDHEIRFSKLNFVIFSSFETS